MNIITQQTTKSSNPRLLSATIWKLSVSTTNNSHCHEPQCHFWTTWEVLFFRMKTDWQKCWAAKGSWNKKQTLSCEKSPVLNSAQFEKRKSQMRNEFSENQRNHNAKHKFDRIVSLQNQSSPRRKKNQKILLSFWKSSENRKSKYHHGDPHWMGFHMSKQSAESCPADFPLLHLLHFAPKNFRENLFHGTKLHGRLCLWWFSKDMVLLHQSFSQKENFVARKQSKTIFLEKTYFLAKHSDVFCTTIYGSIANVHKVTWKEKTSFSHWCIAVPEREWFSGADTLHIK